jgi:hypothetical protein
VVPIDQSPHASLPLNALFVAPVATTIVRRSIYQQSMAVDRSRQTFAARTASRRIAACGSETGFRHQRRTISNARKTEHPVVWQQRSIDPPSAARRARAFTSGASGCAAAAIEDCPRLAAQDIAAESPQPHRSIKRRTLVVSGHGHCGFHLQTPYAVLRCTTWFAATTRSACGVAENGRLQRHIQPTLRPAPR